ncbi:MAG: hypothetical protein ACE141_06065 [Bryobacteraceae bacterium]
MTHDEAIIKARELAALPFPEHRRLLRQFSDEELASIADAVGRGGKPNAKVFAPEDLVLLRSIEGVQLGRRLVANLNANVRAGRETP